MVKTLVIRLSVSLWVGSLNLSLSGLAQAELPKIQGTPTLDTPANLLNWPRDVEATTPDLSEPTSNRLFDLHGTFSNCEDIDLIFSTSGNYHMALYELWYDHFLPNSPTVQNWYYTTSPPIAPEQAANRNLTLGNLALRCSPHIAVGPKDVMAKLEKMGLAVGDPIPILRNRGNVLLVRKGNPKNIQSIWDLGRADVKVVTSNPNTEPGSFSNYSNSIYQIAKNDSNSLEPNLAAAELFNSVFKGGDRWLAGARIHHREVPWSIAYGQADVGLMFYHLALYVQRTFPDLFEIVPLGGTVEQPQPLPGNQIATLFVVRVAGELTPGQEQAREQLIEALLSEQFTAILSEHGIDRP